MSRAGPSWNKTVPYSHSVQGDKDEYSVELDHVNNVKGWSPDCENTTNTNMFAFGVRVMVVDESGVEYIGDWSDTTEAAAYCNKAPAWAHIILICVTVSVLAVSLLLICCRCYQYWYKTRDFFGQVGKELETKFVLAVTDNVDNSPGPEFEMNQFGGGGPSKGTGGDDGDDDADTLLLEDTSANEKTARQKSASESATSDLTGSGCESQGGKSGATDLNSDCSQRSGRPIQADLASTCSGYVSMFRADSGGSGSNYTQFSLPPARPNSTPVPNPQNFTPSSASQYSSTSLPRPSSNPSPVYLSRPSHHQPHSFGYRNQQSEGLGPMVEETSLGESSSPGYSLVTGTGGLTAPSNLLLVDASFQNAFQLPQASLNSSFQLPAAPLDSSAASDLLPPGGVEERGVPEVLSDRPTPSAAHHLAALQVTIFLV